MKYWTNLNEKEVTELICGEIAGMVDFNQRNPHHCYDLFSHTLVAVNEIENDDESYLKAAAFFHDIGKTSVAMEKNGRLVFCGHALVSAEITGRVLQRMGYAIEEIELIKFYVAHHDDFISYVMPDEAKI